ncbi:MAG: hypothetical protein OEU09_18875 [Rhodospirillales bacterium]|nr:hypothetical protein [Rhodospirillales bacterium]MDH3913350.1 hypothetical protein [Rhodospirillales bacterium]MDH3917363.1 hypothetical protein [Rhodospirillales bacterium]MDH3967744.1 hypothetical protein [Rhodospirillales bacterium]
MAICTGLRRATVAGVCLLLLVSCGNKAVTENRFDEECKAAGHAEGSKQFDDCVEQRWARYRYQPDYGK